LGGDEHIDSLLAHVRDRGRVPVTAVGEHDPDRLRDAGLAQRVTGLRDHRLELVAVVV